MPQDGLDLARSFLANGDSAADLRLFEFRSLPPPGELAGNRAFLCRGEELWDSRAAVEEKTLRSMGQKVDPGVISTEECEIGEFSASWPRERAAKRVRRRVIAESAENRPNCGEGGVGADAGGSSRDDGVWEVGFPMVDDARILDLATQLTRAVCETFFDLRAMVLPSMTVAREARRQVQHVVSSLVPAETDTSIRIAVNARRASRLTEASLAESPFSSREVAGTPETSLMGTPSSLSVVLGHESKRLRSLPSLPAKPPFWCVCWHEMGCGGVFSVFHSSSSS